MMAGELRERPAQVNRGTIECYELAPWRNEFGVVAGITTRSADFTLRGAAPEGRAAHCWRAFRDTFSREFPAIVVGYQSHGTRVWTHDSPPGGWNAWPDVDGHVTKHAGTLLAVTLADCVPVYLADPGRGVVGLLHVGWRGLAAGIVEAGLRAFRSLAGSPPADVVNHCGVAICGGCYEVGPEVASQVTGEYAAGPTRVNLRAEILRRLQRLGAGQRASVSPWCTAHDAGRFHSHRATRGAVGRMVAYVGIPLA
jgi:YfiH family protein